jgi:hypothetical protein
MLSSKFVHVSPETSPQSYDLLNRPKSGAYYQEAGLMVCLNELAECLTFLTYSAASLSHHDEKLKVRMFKAGRDLIAHTGALNVENLREAFDSFMQKAPKPVERTPPNTD